MRRTRSALTALFAALGVLIVVAATGNQGLHGTLVDHADGTSFQANVYRTLLSFSWRFTPGNGSKDVWVAQLIGIGAFVLLTFVFVWAVSAGTARPAAGIFVGIWACIVLAAALAGIARSFVYYSALFPAGVRDQQFGGRASYAIFQGSSSYATVFALASGLLIAIFVTIIAAATAREVPTSTAAPATPAGVQAVAVPVAAPSGMEWAAAPAAVAATQRQEPDPWRGEPTESTWPPPEERPAPTEAIDTPWTAAAGSRPLADEEHQQTQELRQPERTPDESAAASTRQFEPVRPAEESAARDASREEPAARNDAREEPSDEPRGESPAEPPHAEQTQRFERPPRWPDDPGVAPPS